MATTTTATTPDSGHNKTEEGHGAGNHSLFDRLYHFVHSDGVENVLNLLLVVDVLIVFIELYLSAEYPECDIIQRDGFCCSGSKTLSCALEKQIVAGCDPHKHHHELHFYHQLLSRTTIGILSAFLVELLVVMIHQGPVHFFSNFLYALDFFIVSVSMALELAPPSTVTSAAGVIVIARLWRFVRVTHGIFDTTYDMAQGEKEELEEYTEAIEKLLREQGIEPPAKREASEVAIIRKKMAEGKKD